jgi:hypothetical protein
METKTVVCEAKCGRYRVGVVLQRGACRGILIVLTWNSKYSRENELNAHTLADEELRTALFWVVTQGVGKLRNDPEECSSHLLCGRSLKSRTDGDLCSKLCVVLDIELVGMKFGCMCVRACVRARARVRAYVHPRIFALRDFLRRC